MTGVTHREESSNNYHLIRQVYRAFFLASFSLFWFSQLQTPLFSPLSAAAVAARNCILQKTPDEPTAPGSTQISDWQVNIMEHLAETIEIEVNRYFLHVNVI